MKCPKCRRKQYFTCSNPECKCNKSIHKGGKPQVRLPNDVMACPYCGFAAHIDYWEGRAMREVFGEGMSEWISVENRLPDKEGKYLVFAKSRNPNAPFINTAWCFPSLGQEKCWQLIPAAWMQAISHWMPLPEPPKD